MTRTRSGATGTIAAVAAACLLAAGCSTEGAHRVPVTGQARGVAYAVPAVSARPYAAADLAFGLDVLGASCRPDPLANIVLSPSSLASGLGMAYLGARGSTATAMAGVLHLPASSVEAGLHARSRGLAALGGRGVTVDEADRVWADPSLQPLRSYLNAVATGYGAGIGLVPLQTDPGQAAAEINASIAEGTGGHITGLLSAQALQQSAFVLTDALYLKAKWAQPFSAASVQSGPFTTAAGNRVSVRYLQGGHFGTATRDGWTAVSLPYAGGKLAMTALLPPPTDSPASCPQLTAAQLAALSRAAAASTGPAQSAGISLPEVSLRDQSNLNGLLTGLGMGTAFGPEADFTGMTRQMVSIGEVEHAATLRVDGQGTVASAATAVTMTPTAIEAPTRMVTFSRPFVVLISAAASGEPLFLARVANPELS
jgi:serine protease inhibitor